MTRTRLTLRVVGPQAEAASCETVARPDGLPFSIGRKQDNAWVLPDPDRHVSKCHCIVERRGADWVVTDTSTNGLYINGAAAPLGPHNTAVLNHGDRLQVGPYSIEVTLAPDATAGFPPPPPADPFPGGLADLLDDPFRGLPAREPPPAAPWPMADHASPERASFRMPQGGTFIPENWDLGGPNDHPRDEPEDPSVPSVVPPPAAPHPASSHPASPLGRPAPPHTTSARPAPAGGDDALWRAFLEGAGLTGFEECGPEERAVLMRLVGATQRAAVEGLLQVMRSRAAVKASIGVDQTLVQALDNNPLKLLPDAETALRTMLAPPRGSFMPADAAIRQALDDIKTHELAMMGVIRDLVAALVKEFDPTALAGRLDPSGPIASLLPAARKAQCWDLYEKHYHRIAAELEEDLLGRFGRVFGRSYVTHGKNARRG